MGRPGPALDNAVDYERAPAGKDAACAAGPLRWPSKEAASSPLSLLRPLSGRGRHPGLQLLRIALRATALRAALHAGDTCGP
jgi:hypothetical protein